MGAINLLLKNAAVFTGDGDTPVPRDIAISGAIIAAIGEPGTLDHLATPLTREHDLTGRLILPGFQDAHVHPVMAGVELLQCDLTETTSAQDCLDVIAAYAAAHPDEPWILGAGWSMEHFPGGTPERAALDAVVADRPVLLQNRDHHGAWVNSRALELAGITAATPDPADGRIERDADGNPSGTLHEGAASLVQALVPEITADQAYQGLLAAQDVLHSFGVTGFQDALIGSALGMSDTTDTYLRALAEGTLRSRVVGALWLDREAGLAQVAEHVAHRDRIAAIADPALLRMDTIKIMADGVAENFTASMHEPYRDAHGHRGHNHGIAFFSADSLREFVTALDSEGFQVHFHALGDRAVTWALDAVAAAREANGPSDHRHHLAHLQMVADADVPRFAQLDATANIQALWACHEDQLDELALPFLADDAVDRHYPFGHLVDAGARIAAGSDWAVSTPDPLQAIHVAVNRVAPGEDLPPLGPPDQALSLAEAVRAYTSGSAFVQHRDDVSGYLRPGYLADLAVLDRNIFDRPAAEIAAATVVETWFAGERVYGDEI